MTSTLKLALVLTVAASLFLAESNSAAAQQNAVELFEKKIRPLLADKCFTCHGQSAMGGLRLDSREGMLKGGASGIPAVVPGDPEKSRMILAVRRLDSKLQMPPGDKLTADQIADLETWIRAGASWGEATDARAPDKAAVDVQKFWSFQPVKHRSPPAVKNSGWVRTEVDRFILARLEEKKLKPVADIDKRALIRRATFDLTGLPPTPGEVEEFLKDKSDTAFAKVVDRLLASPQYGEKWGRHWLDVVRYADTSGCNSDFPIPSAYKYRNYVINSFNHDKPYDQFVREQIAGDLLPAQTEAERFEHVIATGYLAISRRFGSRNNEFHLTIDDTIDNIGKAFLGLSISCARCHDHKYDPIPTSDYYALYGIFSSTRYAFPGTEIYRHTNDFVPLASGDAAERLIKWQTELSGYDDKIERLNDQKGALERKAKREKEKQGAESAPARDDEKAASGRTLESIVAELARIKARVTELEEQEPRIEKAYAVSEGTPANARIFRKGDPRNKGDEVPRGFLQVLGGSRVPDDEKGSGRVELARWLTSSDNPLTARVMVNRIWQYHFGRGLVQTPNDFGTRGKAPTHPELLDYLARKFVESGWSVKAMHRLIMLSRAYQLSSQDDPRNAEADPGNDLQWRFNRRRLEAEEIRDSMLAISGSLDRSMGGPHPFPPEKDWRYTQHVQFIADYDSNRRTVYLMQQRIRKQRLFEVWDGADTNATTPQRPVSTTPVQALFMLNDPFVHKQADLFAVRIGMAFGDDMRRITLGYELAFGRPPSKEELRIGIDYLRRVADELKSTAVPVEQQPRAALGSYCRMLFSSSEFLFVD